MTDEIQQLIDIHDRASANEYLRRRDERRRRLIASRMLQLGERDHKYIKQITLCRIEEIEGLKTYLTMEQVMHELGLSEMSLKKYIRQCGLTVYNRMIPRYAIELAKDSVYGILMQKEYQDKKLKTQTQEEYLLEIEERIAEYEEMFLGGFWELYGHLTDEELDLMDEGMEIKAWKVLIEELREIQSRIGE
ncbi:MULTISPECIES: hypothetical protein [Paenibacillus]|uniref:Uncharacterized protein n=1 Tax=Paenibacillus urinalis TaxID=521520 RepID=A0AAX3N2L1_9BACL|nr:hypothetical protein [Paenibacillus urinalis]WDH83349.1 hypothetical protein PUW23_03635 [Paenibacillus urinalis]